MPIYVPGKVTLRQTYIGTDDPDAAAYIAAVEAADEIASPGIGGLETATKVAIHSFVKGCKNDGMWPALKASCILAGARTLDGALVPLVGPAPTNNNNNFVSGDYDRKTGLVGGDSKYLNSNRNNNADPRNNKHIAAHMTSVQTTGQYLIAMGSDQNVGDSLLAYRWDNTNKLRYSINDSAQSIEFASLSAGLYGVSRSSASNYIVRRNGANVSVTINSATPTSTAILLFRATGIAAYATHRIAFYSIGESLDLALLDARVTDLITAFGVAIP